MVKVTNAMTPICERSAHSSRCMSPTKAPAILLRVGAEKVKTYGYLSTFGTKAKYDGAGTVVAVDVGVGVAVEVGVGVGVAVEVAVGVGVPVAGKAEAATQWVNESTPT